MPPTPQEETQVVNNVWGTSPLGGAPTFLTFPSGQTGYAKAVGLQGIMEAGLLGEADSLTAYVGREHVRRVRGAKGRPDGEEMNAETLMRDPSALKKIVKLVDSVAPLVMAEPKVLCHFEVLPDGDTKMIEPSDRVPGAIYTDQLPLEDKMFLFQFATSGVTDAQSFRQESAAAVGAVVDGQGVQSPTVASAGQKRRRPPRRR